MREIQIGKILVLGVLGLSACVEPLSETQQAAHVQLSGAIFTTLVDGTQVNANIYDAKQDVYLDGGPGPNAPPGAAGLPAGEYFFQVTDPSGVTLLSEDEIGCRGVVVNDDGVITGVVVPAGYTCTTGTHALGTDVDQGPLARTVQLMPYEDTPNNGGEYKAWLTPVGDYEEGEGTHGFIEAYSKTDNFKVRGKDEEPPCAPEPYCGDGNLDAGEACDDGNDVNTDACTNACEFAACGDGYVQTGEACDDGNDVNTDACTNACELATCGDGYVQTGEVCDDGNDVNTDACVHCQPATCGDGYVQAGVEACDGGDACTSTCELKGVCDGYCHGEVWTMDAVIVVQ